MFHLLMKWPLGSNVSQKLITRVQRKSVSQPAIRAKGIFLGLWKMPGFFWVAKTTEGFFWLLYFSSAQIKNNTSAIYSFVFGQKQSWSWHVLAFQKLNNKICWCKKTEGFFWVDKFWSWDFLGYKIWTSVWPPPVIKICEWGPWNWLCPFEC